MNIPLNAQVYCTDGKAGRTQAILLNPVTDQVTHVVVESRGLLGIEHMVPIELVTESAPDWIQLRCTQHELEVIQPFTRSEYINADGLPEEFTTGTHDWRTEAYTPEKYGADGLWLWPYYTPDDEYERYITVEQVPPDELAIHRGSHVEATDGRVGRVDAFLVNPMNSHISHLVLREGHLWNTQDVTIPVSDIDHIESDTVYLKLDMHSVHGLPAVPVAQ
jgi:sporulation protein YlmC with PRC-barrel domain